MIPGRALVLLAIAPLLVALLTLFDRTLIWPLLALNGGILLLAGFDALLAIRPLVTVKRSAPDVFSIGRVNLVTLELRSRGRRRLSVAVTDDLFDDAASDELPARAVLPARGRSVVRYRVLPNRRGAYQLGDHHVRYRSPLGLWLRQLNIAARLPVRVYPDVQAVRAYELLARQNREHSLFRSSRLLGGESEFERLREYRREDEYRAIDWKATARRRKLIAREYQLERNQSIMFMLDAGRLMTAEARGLPLFDYALNATLMLSHVAARNGDSIGLLAFSDEVKSYAPLAGGHKAAKRVVQASYDLHPELVETDFAAAFDQISVRVRKRALVVVFTQVLDEVAAAELVKRMHALLPRHLPMLVLLRDIELDALLETGQGAPSESGMTPTFSGMPSPKANEVDWYLRGAAAELVSWRERIGRDLKKRGALVLDVAPGQLTPSLINRYLEIKTRHLL